MKANQIKSIMVFFLASALLFDNYGHTNEIETKSARMNMGYYYNSISDVANRTDIEISLNFWARDLFVTEAKKQNFIITSTQAFLFDHIEDMKNAFDQGELDLIVAPPLLISRYFEREKLSDGFVGVLEGKKPESLVLIVRSDKNINSVKDLRGKRLGMIENDELADIFLDTLMLKDIKRSYKNIGLSIQQQKKNNHLILDIFFDRIDAGVVYMSSYNVMTELNPEIKSKIKILEELRIKGKNFSYFRHDYPLTESLTNVAMGFATNPRGKQILEIFSTPEIDYCKVEDLDVFDTLYKDYLRLKQRKKKMNILILNGGNNCVG